MRLTDADRARQLAHTREAMALCDRVATPEELAAAAAHLQRAPAAPQQDLFRAPSLAASYREDTRSPAGWGNAVDLGANWDPK